MTSLRMDWTQRAIALAQTIGAATTVRNAPSCSLTSSRPFKRAKTEMRSLLFAPHSIPALPSPPSLGSYLARHCHQPFILPRYTSDSSSACPPWPAVTRWADPEYLLSRVGQGRWVPVEEGAAYDDKSWGQRIVPFEDFLRRAGFGKETSARDGRPMYLAQHSLFRQFPDLERDVVIPDFVWSRPAPPAHLPEYRPPANQDGLVINVWVGSGSGEIVSPAHTASRMRLVIADLCRIHITTATHKW